MLVLVAFSLAWVTAAVVYKEWGASGMAVTGKGAHYSLVYVAALLACGVFVYLFLKTVQQKHKASTLIISCFVIAILATVVGYGVDVLVAKKTAPIYTKTGFSFIYHDKGLVVFTHTYLTEHDIARSLQELKALKPNLLLDEATVSKIIECLHRLDCDGANAQVMNWENRQALEHALQERTYRAIVIVLGALVGDFVSKYVTVYIFFW